MKCTAAFLGIPEEKLHINVSFTMLMVNVSDGDYSFTKFQRIEGHGVNMTAISAVSKLSWRAIENDYTLEQYEAELEEIRKCKRNYTPWHPLLACALFIVPGVPLINFVDDMLDNYIQVGIVRAVNTLLMVFAMAFGIAFAVKICHIENFFPTISMVPHHTYIEYAIAAAISAMGFSMIFNIPRRLL